MDFFISLEGKAPLGAQLYAQLKRAVLTGRLKQFESLPSSRQLADTLSVSRNTVLRAYAQLTAEGFIETRRGAGTFVSGEAIRPRPAAPQQSALRPVARRRLVDESRFTRPNVRYDFSVGVPDPALFPFDEWRSALSRQWRGKRQILDSTSIQGIERLRVQIAQHIARARSVKARADDVLVTNGAQQAFHLIARVLLEPKACVAVEAPGYLAAHRALASTGARVVGVKVDSEGLVVDALPAQARLVYVTPSHQFPLGTVMSLARRVALLRWSEKRQAAILEDDYDSEFRYRGRPLESLQSLDSSGRVLYVGTFSKVLTPSLRLGFLVAPAALMPSFCAAKWETDSFTAPHGQMALAALMEDGFFARHMRRLRRVYQSRYEVLMQALSTQLSEDLEVLPSSAGLHVCLRFKRKQVIAARVVRQALSDGVALEDLRALGGAASWPGLVLGYGRIRVEDIDAGIRRLAGSIQRAR